MAVYLIELCSSSRFLVMSRIDIQISSIQFLSIHSHTLLRNIIVHHGDKSKSLTSSIGTLDNTGSTDSTNLSKEFSKIILSNTEIQISNVEFAITNKVGFTSARNVGFYAFDLCVWEGDELVTVIECEKTLGGLEP